MKGKMFRIALLALTLTPLLALWAPAAPAPPAVLQSGQVVSFAQAVDQRLTVYMYNPYRNMYLLVTDKKDDTGYVVGARPDLQERGKFKIYKSSLISSGYTIRTPDGESALYISKRGSEWKVRCITLAKPYQRFDFLMEDKGQARYLFVNAYPDTKGFPYIAGDKDGNTNLLFATVNRDAEGAGFFKLVRAQ